MAYNRWKLVGPKAQTEMSSQQPGPSNLMKKDKAVRKQELHDERGHVHICVIRKRRRISGVRIRWRHIRWIFRRINRKETMAP